MQTGPNVEIDIASAQSRREETTSRRDLLYVMVALRNGFFEGPELLEALRDWALDDADSIEEALSDRGRLSPARRELIESILNEIEEADCDRSRPRNGFDVGKNAETGARPIAARNGLARTQPLQTDVPSTGAADTADMDDPDATRMGGLDAVGSFSRYKKLRPLAKGGVGIVFVARDDELGREVAVKELQDAYADDTANRGRFMREAEITGGLEHPGIVPVHGLGRQPDGRPYYAMRLIKGESLRDAIDRYHKSGQAAAAESPAGSFVLRRLLARFVAVCETIAYAHSRRIVHRDLKPSNIVLGHYGETLVVDWGLAKPLDRHETVEITPAPATKKKSKRPDHAVEAGSFDEDPLTPSLSAAHTETLPGSAMGTPGYMSPEQAVGRLDRLGPRSDIYSLGATLYCLLTGRAAFEGQDLGELVRRVERGDFEPPRRLNSKVDPDLEAVCLKAMALRPEDRYASARALAEDVEHWLADEPVSARREHAGEKVTRWARRHQTWARALTATLVCLAFASMTAALAVNRARGMEKKERRLAQDQKKEAERLTAALTIDRAIASCERGNVGRGMLWLTRELALSADNPSLERVTRMNLSAWRRVISPLREILPHAGWVQSVAYRADGKALLVGGGPEGERGSAQVWDPLGGEPIGEPLKHGSLVLSVAFHPNGRVAATAGTNGLVRFWDLTTSKPLDRVVSHQAEVVHVCFNGDGSRLLTACRDGTLQFWDFESAKPIGPPMRHSAPIGVAALSPDGRLIATATTENAVYLWDAATGKALGAPIPQPDQVYALAFDPKGNTLAVGSRDHAIRFWNVRTRSVARPSLFGHIAPITSLAFCPAGVRIVSGADDNTVRVWDLASGETIGSPFEHRGSVVSIAFCPDGQSFATGSRDENARIWFAPKLPPGAAVVHSGRIFALDLSPDGKYLLVGGEDHRARLYDAKTGAPVGPVQNHKGVVTALAFSPDGRSAISGSMDGELRLWNVPGGEPRGKPMPHPRKLFRTVFRPDGRAIASACADGLVRFWDVTTCETIGTALAHPAPVLTLAYSPNGKVIVTGCADNIARLWNAETGQLLGPVMRHQGPIYAAAFSADGRLIATAGDDNTARVWDADTGKAVGLPLEHMGSIMALAFHPDPKTRLLATGSRDMSTRLWDVDAGKSIGPALLQKGSVFGLAFRADGRVLYSAGTDQTVRAWVVPHPFPGEPKSLALWAQTLTGMQLDPDGAARVLSAPEWHSLRRLAKEAGAATP